MNTGFVDSIASFLATPFFQGWYFPSCSISYSSCMYILGCLPLDSHSTNNSIQHGLGIRLMEKRRERERERGGEGSAGTGRACSLDK